MTQAKNREASSGWLLSFLRERVLQRLARLRSGALVVREGEIEQQYGSAAAPLGLVVIEVHDPEFWRAIALRGALGAGESWMAGHWWTADPARVVRLLLRDREVLEGVDSGLARLGKPLLRLWHSLRRNTRKGSRANIQAHYDLGDDFFAEFLDPTMTYSSAVFSDEGAGMEDGQRSKLRRLCHKLELGACDHMLEIGTGWGSMALTAAGEFGARVTTTTISSRQLQAARARVTAAGLGGKVDVLGSDYRDLQGTYDKLVSVEMIEAVGHHYLDTFFARCGRLLRPGGRFAMQAITIADQHYDAALRRVDFIKRHVFPGCFIPSTQALLQAATKSSDLRLRHVEDFARHYAETLRRWRLRLDERRQQILDLGYPEELLRTWQWYLAYCEGGFAEGYLGVVQLLFERPGGDRPTTVPSLPEVAADPYQGDFRAQNVTVRPSWMPSRRRSVS
jgi:cyclopropane-fatty-acyl-phospholipid synthase